MEAQLLAVAGMEVERIQAWRQERLSDAATFHENPVFAGLVDAALYRSDTGAEAQLRAWLEPVQRVYQYRRVAVLDSAGRTRIAVPDVELSAVHGERVAEYGRSAMDSGTVVIQGFHRDAPDDPVHLTVIAPILDAGGDVLGAVALWADAAIHLHPALLRWPTPTRTAETYLVRRDGDHVLFLTDLRFSEGAALDLRIPLDRADLPAAQAIRGAEGIVDGVDYRGEPALAAVRSVPGTDWKLVAQIDVEEAFGPLQERLGWTLGLLAILFLLLIGALGFAWQRREKNHFRDLALAERRHGTLLRSIGDAVFATDREGRVEVMNPVAERLTGWPEDEARGRPLQEVFRIINEETREPPVDPVARVLTKGKAVDLANHTLLIARDGSEIPIADSAAPVRDPDRRLTGVILVFRDQTEERAARRRIEEALDRAQLYLDVSGVMIVVLDREGRVELINRRGVEILGYPETEIVGSSWVDRFVPETEREEIREVRRRAIAGDLEGAGSIENAVVTRDGEERVIAWENEVIRDEDGAITHTISSGRDVTEQRRAEAALRQSEARHRNLFNSIRDAILVTGTDRKIIDCNPAFTELFGYELDEIRGKQTSEVHASEAEFREMGERLRGHMDDPGFIHVSRYRRKSGQVFPGETSAFYLRDDAGEVVGFIGLIRDITERRRAEEELQKRQTMLERTERLAHVGSWELDVDTGDVTWSDELFRIFGRDPEAGAPPLDEHAEMFPPEYWDRLRTAIERAVRDGEPYDLELHAVRTDGEPLRVRAGGYSAHDVGPGATRLYGFVEDITERKRQEEREAQLTAQLAQAQKVESVGRLAGGVAHDFNNMLSVILGHVDLAREKVSPDDPLFEDLDEVRKAAESSAKLTSQLLAYAREQVAAPKVVDLNRTIGNMLSMLRRLIGEEIELVWRPGESAGSVKVDPVQIDQVLANLLVNARDAIDGQGRVTIETRRVTVDPDYAEFHAAAEPGEYVLVTVTDTGCGMAPDVRRQIFDPFFTTKEVGQGTGLGLSTVYGIVRQNGGFINVYSEPGHGTTVKMHFPRHHGAAEKPAPRESKEPRAAGGGETVLVVEDQPAVLSLARKILEGRGYQVLTAASPGEALERAEEEPTAIHLLVTDVIMPEMNGRELADRMSAVYPDLVVLFMSGYAEDVIAERGVVEEGVHFLEKPFTAADLAAAVRAALDSRERP